MKLALEDIYSDYEIKMEIAASMRISSIYSSNSPYRWQAGKYKRKAHKKAIARVPRKPKAKGAFDK